MDQIRLRVREVVTQISAFLTLVADIHVARHVDIDGIRQGGTITNDHYSHSVDNARRLVRTLETALQVVYDDTSALLLTAQALPGAETSASRGERESAFDLLDTLSSSLKSNLNLVKGTVEALLAVGHEQADVAQGDYNGSIEWRMSRLSVITNQFGGAQRADSKGTDTSDENEDVVDMEVAFNRPGLKKQRSVTDFSYDSHRTLSNGGDGYDSSVHAATRDSEISHDQMVVSQSGSDLRNTVRDVDGGPLFDDDREW